MTAQFYDHLAPYYHLLYGDWEQSIVKQGGALAELLQELGVTSGERFWTPLVASERRPLA
jgi:hypothetical protein